MARDMHELRELPSLDSCQKRFLWAHKEVDLAYPVVVLVLTVAVAQKFPQELFLRSESASRVYVSQPRGGWE